MVYLIFIQYELLIPYIYSDGYGFFLSFKIDTWSSSFDVSILKNMERIQFTSLMKMLEAMDKDKSKEVFAMKFVKKGTGEIVDIPKCSLASFHTKGSTLNILLPNEIKPKSIRKCLVIEYNGKSVYR